MSLTDDSDEGSDSPIIDSGSPKGQPNASLFDETRAEKRDAPRQTELGEIVGRSAGILEVLRQVDTVAQTESTVLICGETGTGKELIAEAIHRRGARARGPFVKLNCAAIPLGLLESELFGHERGAFTGASSRRIGRFELAQSGTLCLDEIGEMPLEVQPKLLRLLQEREFERLGSSFTLRSNARLIAATNRNLGAMVGERTFREDLYYRLNVFPIYVPPLRERREDIAILACKFVQQFARRMNKAVPSLSRATMLRLEDYDWPGNIRELQNVLERAVILATGSELEVSIEKLGRRQGESPTLSQTGDALDEINRAHILGVLRRTNWVISGPSGAALLLGMKRSTLNFRMKKLGISRRPTLSGTAMRAG